MSDTPRIAPETPARAALPRRRPQATVKLEHQGRRYQASIGYCPRTGRPAEVFVAPDHKGQEALLLEDIAVVISVALQHGIPAAAFARSLGRVPAPGDALGRALAPASMVGVMVDLLVAETAAVPPACPAPGCGLTDPAGCGRGGCPLGGDQ